MVGTKAGAQKTKATLLAKDPNFYKKAGSKSWDNPDRSHKTGFALMDEETHKEVSSRGGKKTKKDYHKKIITETIEALAPALDALAEADQASSDTGE